MLDKLKDYRVNRLDATSVEALDSVHQSTQTSEQRASRLFATTRVRAGPHRGVSVLTVVVFLFLIGGFWVLQVRDHEVNSELAERNRIKTVPLLAPRGKILDRDGRVIVDNHSSFDVI